MQTITLQWTFQCKNHVNRLRLDSVQKEAFSISIFSTAVESDVLEESLRFQYQQINVRKYVTVSNIVYFYNVELYSLLKSHGDSWTIHAVLNLTQI